MANDTGTSAGKISLLLQIKANIEQQVSDMANRATQRAKEKFAKVGEDAGCSIEKGFNSAIKKKNASIKSMEKQLEHLQEKIDSIASSKIKDYEGFFPDKNSLHEAVGKQLDNDKSYQKLLSQAEKLDEKIRLSKEKLSYDIQAFENRNVRMAEKAAEREAQAKERAAERARKAEERVRIATEKARAKQLKMATKGFRTLGRNILRSFKSVFMMTAVYAAFKTLRSLLSSATADSKKFTDSLNIVKANLLGAFTPIVSAVMPMLERLMSGLASVTTRITSFIAGIFGKTYRQVMAKTKKLQSTAKGSGSKGSLAGFDEINQLSGDSSGTAGIDFSAIDSKGDETASKLGEKFARAFTKIKTFLSPVSEAMEGMFEGALLSYFSFVNAVSPGMMSLWHNVFLPTLTWIRDGVVSAFNFMSERFDATAQFFTSRSEIISKALKNIGIWANALWTDFICPVLDKLWNGIKETLSWIQTAFGGVIDFLLGVFTGDWERMAHGLTTIILGMANAIISAFESIVNSAIDVVNGLISRVKNTGLGQWVSGIIDLKEIQHLNLGRFTIPEFASGATINQPTLGLMGEYAGAYSNPEIVSPQSLMLETFMAAVEPLVASIRELITNSTMGQTIHIHLDASLSALARALQPYLDDEAKRHGVKLVVET